MRGVWRRVLGDSIALSIGVATMTVLQVGFRLVATRGLPVAEYGRVALLLSGFNALLLIAHLGVPVTAARLTARADGSGREILGASSRAAALPCLVASTVVAGLAYAITGSAGLALVAGAGMPPMAAAVVAGGWLRGKGSVWASATIQPANAAFQLALLLAAVGAGVELSAGWVLTSFSAGNAAACVVAVALIRHRLHRERAAPPVALAPEARPRRILAFSSWLALGNLAVIGLPVVLGAALARSSFSQVAYFDLALLLYSVVGRFRASFVAALVPVASAFDRRGRQLGAPGGRELALLVAAVGALELLLFRTHLVRDVLEAVGLADYADAEGFFLVLLLAAPAELLFGVNTGLLVARAEARPLAFANLVVSGLAAVAGGVAVAGAGAKSAAVVFVLAYWLLYASSRALLLRPDRRPRLLPRPSGIPA